MIKKVLPLVVAIIFVTAGTSSARSAPTRSTDSHTYTIGLLTDLTGAASDVEVDSPLGVKAAVGLAAKEGYHIKFYVADTGTNPTQTLAAAQSLVEQHHVFAVMAASALTFSAAPWLTENNIPVVGSSEDGSEWNTSKNMFSVTGTPNYSDVNTTYGKLMKLLGATTVGVVGTGISPSSSLSAKAEGVSAQEAGLKVGYLNADLVFGTTNVQPEALAMKTAGVNGMSTTINTSTSLALVSALHVEGVHLKAALLATGYGGDLPNGGPDATSIAQGGYFQSGYEPVEMHTAATEQFQKALSTYAGVKGDPTLGEYLGYLSVEGFVTGLKAAGPNPTQASFIKTMLGITHFNGAGLYGSHSVGFTMSQRGKVSGADDCIWVTKYVGSSFKLVPGADPICGENIPGKTVS
jgi:branched-chain amino acid transport system substrate-binding protein